MKYYSGGTEKIFLHWEMTQEEFNEKVDFNFISERLIEREDVKIFVTSEDNEIVTERTYYRSMSGDIFATRPITYKNVINVLDRGRITDGNKSLQR